MKQHITKYRESIDQVKRKIKYDLMDYFKSMDLYKKSNDFQVLQIRDETDLDKLWYNSGFYLILTDYQVNGIDSCSLEYSNYKVIYRGHSYFTKKRVISHLANDTYNSSHSGKGVHYGVCLKMDNSGRNGININQEPYNSWGWMVIVFKMKDSDKLIREQAEVAFDEVFGRPCRSMER
ncbi:hypothetical protein K1F50_03590 [Muricauda oceani]|uniref:Uncharacterized protein n=2 Tax=Flavobacteriaceae TaxID=49546 RepID=A0A6G7J8N2_9FLAO|nr:MULTISPECIES: hypothetical protein [Allomuricauda]MBW8241870.1 hypothetical protein [Allomuricauda oceani]QII46787.1 hypothetical protein GVT53_19575 [Allomuricauda oceani]